MTTQQSKLPDEIYFFKVEGINFKVSVKDLPEYITGVEQIVPYFEQKLKNEIFIDVTKHF
jgi:hypothetical protein